MFVLKIKIVNFSNFKQKDLNWEQKKSDKMSQAFLKDTPVPPNNQIRMTVTNENGASEKSPIFLVKCLGECGMKLITLI